MTAVADYALDEIPEERPIELTPAYTPADRKFFGLLACSAAMVFMLLVAIMVFLLYHGWWALHHFNFKFFFGTNWSAPGHPGVLALLGGSVEVALVALVFAVPVSIATALMINEFAPKRLRGWLTALIDLLATVPSIVYGFWGLEAFSQWVERSLGVDGQVLRVHPDIPHRLAGKLRALHLHRRGWSSRS